MYNVSDFGDHIVKFAIQKFNSKTGMETLIATEANL